MTFKAGFKNVNLNDNGKIKLPKTKRDLLALLNQPHCNKLKINKNQI
jgi:hypothetical protein